MQLVATTNSDAMMEHAFHRVSNAIVVMIAEMDLTKSTALFVARVNSSAQQASALTKIENAIDILTAGMQVMKLIVVSINQKNFKKAFR